MVTALGFTRPQAIKALKATVSLIQWDCVPLYSLPCPPLPLPLSPPPLPSPPQLPREILPRIIGATVEFQSVTYANSMEIAAVEIVSMMAGLPAAVHQTGGACLPVGMPENGEANSNGHWLCTLL